jgi:hypothetical protein
MMKTQFALSVLISLLLGVSAAQAQTTTIQAVQMQLVDVTTSEVKGNEGVFGMTALCVAEVSADSRMCNTAEAWNTVKLPAISNDAWLRPVLESTQAIFYDRTTGTAGILNLYCVNNQDGPWQSTSANGLAIRDDGRIKALGCDTRRPVACCAFRAITAEAPNPS